MFTDLDDLIDAFEREKKSITAVLVSGNCDTFEQYRWLVGKVDGLTKAIDIIKNYETSVLEDMENDD